MRAGESHKHSAGHGRVTVTALRGIRPARATSSRACSLRYQRAMNPTPTDFAALVSMMSAMQGTNPFPPATMPPNSLFAQFMNRTAPHIFGQDMNALQAPVQNGPQVAAQNANVPQPNLDFPMQPQPPVRNPNVPQHPIQNMNMPQAANQNVPQMRNAFYDMAQSMATNNGMGMLGFMQQQNPMQNIMTQVMNEACRNTVPITSAEDESRLVRVLYESEIKGQTYRQAIETLHGTNDHTAMIWKDYYLDHTPRLNRLVANLRAAKSLSANRSSQSGAPSSSSGRASQPQPFASGSRPRSDQARPPASQSSASPSNTHRTHQLYDGHRSHGSSVPQPGSSSSRHHVLSHSAIRSQQSKPSEQSTGRQWSSTRTAVNAGPFVSLHPVRWAIKIPDPPSREPTPPTRVEFAARGNKYTEDDQAFFIKFIQWKLKEDPTLAKEPLCTLLSQKVPSHSAPSWSTYWTRHSELPDEILREANSNAPRRHAATNRSDSEEGASSDHRSQPSHNEAAVEASIQAEDDDASSSDNESEWEAEDADTDDDLNNMGHPGELWTYADLRIMARYIASQPNWDNMARSERWLPYAAKHPRSSESYAQGYVSHMKKLLFSIFSGEREGRCAPFKSELAEAQIISDIPGNRIPWEAYEG
ncbi:hypothetical protein B0H21DRAFT_723370 [Amylocystis lapponica]|nr:hypothetical protein B0H21DRAFT_723370 [Amylocystis lapponica]